MDIQQGNIVTSKMMLQLRPGMNKSQVRFIMGTPLIQDTFHSNRWDYFYQMRKSGKIVEQRRVILEFDNDQLARVRGDVIAAGSGGEQDQSVANPAPISEPGKNTSGERDSKTLKEKLQFWKPDGSAAEANKPQEAPADLVNAPPVQPKVRAVAEPAADQAEPVTSEPVIAPSQPATTAPAEEPVAKPEPSKPVPAVKPATSSAEPAPSTPRAVSKPVSTEAEKDLPDEGEPGYFERMLEKIGF